MQNKSNKCTEPGNTFSKKIGRGTYTVKVFFSKTSKESFNDKVIRLVKNDILNEVKRE